MYCPNRALLWLHDLRCLSSCSYNGDVMIGGFGCSNRGMAYDTIQFTSPAAYERSVASSSLRFHVDLPPILFQSFEDPISPSVNQRREKFVKLPSS